MYLLGLPGKSLLHADLHHSFSHKTLPAVGGIWDENPQLRKLQCVLMWDLWGLQTLRFS